MLALLRSSVGVTRQNLGISLALGAAVVISLCSVCAGIGLLLAPWFVCELAALQLEAHGRPVKPRGDKWVLAGIVVLGMVIVVASAGWLAALGFGPDVASADSASAPLPWPETLRRIGLIVGALVLAVAFTSPFLHAPAILLSRGGRLGGALLESATLMRHAGLLRHLSLSFLAQLLCLSPALLSAMVIARTMERAATPLGILLALPLLPLSIPLGLGLVTKAYVDDAALLGDARRAQRQPSLSLLHRLVLIGDVVAPLVGLALVGASALLPLGPRRGPAPEGLLVASLRPGPHSEEILRIPDTTLEVRVRPEALELVSGLEEPLIVPRRGSLEELRVVRLPQSYAIELEGDGGVRHLAIDGAGVRVDDSVRRRLEGHLPTWLLATFLLGFAVIAFGAPLAFAPAGQARAEAARTLSPLDPAGRLLSLRIALSLSPFALMAAAAGTFAFFGT